MEKKVTADKGDFEGIGPITGEFCVYDREREVRQRMPNIRLLESYLDETGGVRVYRDSIRVYSYGERRRHGPALAEGRMARRQRRYQEPDSLDRQEQHRGRGLA